ncbi:hypothetical protein [Streptomyces sp. NPDC048277]|uniref:hypothetical protein n=1 Tax=Streptomyces sp. NPDC048277 TaxID=3155027 RepID=UPI0033DD240D
MTSPVAHDVHRSHEQLGRVFGQLQKVLKQREDSLRRRREWTKLSPEASPEEQLVRLQVLGDERGRQLGMQKLADRISGLADQLVGRLTPTEAQREMHQMLKSRSQEMTGLEQSQRQLEDLMEPTPSTALQVKMLRVAGKVHQLTIEMGRPSSVSPRVPAPSAQAATATVAERETAQTAAARYEQARIAARQDKTAQKEAVAMAGELGYDPARLADAIQGYSKPGSAAVAAAASLHPLGPEGRKSPSAAAAAAAAAVPQASASANAAKSPPSATSSSRRSR